MYVSKKQYFHIYIYFLISELEIFQQKTVEPSNILFEFKELSKNGGKREKPKNNGNFHLSFILLVLLLLLVQLILYKQYHSLKHENYQF